MITVEFKGRHGNNMFQYATCRSIAEKKGYNFYVDQRYWQGYEMFDNLYLGKRDGIPITKEFIETAWEYQKGAWDIEDGTSLRGFFQSEQYFDNDKARQWFKLKPDQKAEELLLQYPVDEYCYINLRGTDVKELGVQKLSLAYYDLAREVIRSVTTNIKYVVITDDTPFGHEYFPDYPVMTNSMHTDFTLLNRAKYVIIADSTFSWWATWLNKDNFVVAPHGWLNVNQNKWIFGPKDIKVLRFVWV